MRMKRLSILILAVLLLSGCYEDYVRDFDYSGVYFAYQYDLRTFVVGEGEAFDVTVALGGRMKNDRDRKVTVEIDQSLVGADAFNGLMGRSGGLSGDYVSTALRNANVTSVQPLPAESFTVSGLEGLTIAKGRHTAAFRIKATPAFIASPGAYSPGYALGFRILEADADKIVEEKRFAVVAVHCEHRFWGNWSHRATIRSYDASGTLTGSERIEESLADGDVFALTTVDASTVQSGKMTGIVGAMRLTFNGDQIAVASADGTVTGEGHFNGAKLLQDRELYLKYDISLGGGVRKEVSDTLRFRNRIRDGVNEWQDENP